MLVAITHFWFRLREFAAGPLGPATLFCHLSDCLASAAATHVALVPQELARSSKTSQMARVRGFSFPPPSSSILSILPLPPP